MPCPASQGSRAQDMAEDEPADGEGMLWDSAGGDTLTDVSETKVSQFQNL